MSAPSNPYECMWSKVNELDRKGRPQSALEELEKIYTQSKANNDADDFVKSIIFKLLEKQKFEDTMFQDHLKSLIKDAEETSMPQKAILYLFVAELYKQYSRSNFHAIIKRTDVENFDNPDLETWTINKINSEALKYIHKALEEPETLLKYTPDSFPTVVHKGNKPSFCRPTLYDLVAYGALNIVDEMMTPTPETFFYAGSEYFDLNQFINIEVKCDNPLSLNFIYVQILQQLARVRATAGNEDALVDFELFRLKRVSEKSCQDNKQELMMEALKLMQQRFSNAKYKAAIDYTLARFYFDQVRDVKEFGEENSHFRSIAHQICCRIESDQTADSEYRIAALNLVADLETKEFSFIVEEVVPPEANFPIMVNYKNISKLYAKIVKIDESAYESININEHDHAKKLGKYLGVGSIASSFSKDIPDKGDFLDRSTEIIIPKLSSCGFYLLILSDDEGFSSDSCSRLCPFHVSDMIATFVRTATGSQECYIKSRSTGKPLSDITLTLSRVEYDRELRKNVRVKYYSEFKTDKEGYALLTVPSMSNVSYDITASGPASDTLNCGCIYFSRCVEESECERIQTFTDRAIYRPGQTVYFKCYVMKTDKNRVTTPVNGKECCVSLRDVNNKEVGFMKARTNEFGTFGGSLQIPTGLLNGTMSIVVNGYYKRIRVEEYKRPTFEVCLNHIEGSYLVGEEITVTGNAKSYSGMKIDGAEVKFRVQRVPHFDLHRHFYFMPLRQIPVEIVHGTVVADENGDFKFTFKAVPDAMAGSSPDVAFRYITSVELTDNSGETRTATQTVTVGFSSLAVSVEFPSRHFRDSQFEASVKATNLDGSPLKLKGQLTVTRLTDNGLLRCRRWNVPDTHSYTKDEWQKLLPGLAYEKEYLPNSFVRGATVASREFNTEESSKYVIDELRSAESGSYVIEVTAKDPKTGLDMSNQSYFTVAGSDDKTLPQPSFLEAVVLTENPRVGDVARILLGTSVKDATVLHKVCFGDNGLKCEHISLSNSIRILEIPVTQDMVGNIEFFFSLVHNNCSYSQNLHLTIPDVERKLKIDYLSFRDKLQPGENETWKLKITDSNGRNVSAEMVATLYDKSLDAFAPNSCDIVFPSKSQSHGFSFHTGTLGTRHCAYFSDRRTRLQTSPSVAYGCINWFGYYYRTTRREMMVFSRSCRGGGMQKQYFCREKCEKAPLKMRMMKMARTEASAMTDGFSDATVASTLASGSAAEPAESTPEVKIRENFNETAFFYPQLRTDENGEIAVEFTIPESLTTWKMLGLAHTQRLQYVFADKELVTQKQLMVQPNPPRFFRENDRIVLPVKVGNLTAEPLSGSVTLEIIDPFTETKVDGVVRTTTLPFSCNAGGNASLEYELQIPERFSALAYKVIAKSGSFADGEKKVIPVMKNRMLVTESIPLPINGGTTKNYKFEKLLSSGDSSTLRHHKLTLEFTSNPAWYAIQALPFMMEYPYECNEQTFSRLYANSIAAHIANSSPKIKAVFDAWRQADSNELISNLEKNQELKSLLLQETPWVMEGANETERKKRVGLLFDLNRIAGEESKTLEKLRKNQYPSGGWPWFDGMPESDYVTMHIVSGIGHLKRLGVKVFTGPENAPIADRAVDYIDGMLEKRYNELKRLHNEKELKEGDFLSFTVIDYLYARSFFVEKAIPNSAKEAFNFFKGKAEEYWLSRGKYSQAMICLALNRFGSTKVPQEILTSLKERSTSSEEMGMYFVDNTAGFLWHQAPIETQSIIIEAFDEVGKDQKIVDLLKIWLLKNKQTNDWKTTKATAEACYALLLRGTDLLADSKICTISLGGMPVDPSVNPDIRSEAGTGYFKTSWGGGEIKPAMGEVSVTNPNQCVAWGALYWQYFEQLDKITLAETPLKLSKKLFREKVTDSGKVIEPVTDETELKPGDKIAVRIEIRTDRDMEYVHLKDMRASGFEPVNVLSGYRRQDGLGYYECTKDASTNFFIEFLPKGTYVFEYRLFVQHRGDFSNGITSIQCMYAPEFTAHSEGIRVKVN